MSRIDALREERASAHVHLCRIVADLRHELALVEMQVASQSSPVTRPLERKATALTEASQIWEATRMATERAEIEARYGK